MKHILPLCILLWACERTAFIDFEMQTERALVVYGKMTDNGTAIIELHVTQPPLSDAPLEIVREAEAFLTDEQGTRYDFSFQDNIGTCQAAFSEARRYQLTVNYQALSAQSEWQQFLPKIRIDSFSVTPLLRDTLLFGHRIVLYFQNTAAAPSRLSFGVSYWLEGAATPLLNPIEQVIKSDSIAVHIPKEMAVLQARKRVIGCTLHLAHLSEGAQLYLDNNNPVIFPTLFNRPETVLYDRIIGGWGYFGAATLDSVFVEF